MPETNNDKQQKQQGSQQPQSATSNTSDDTKTTDPKVYNYIIKAEIWNYMMGNTGKIFGCMMNAYRASVIGQINVLKRCR